MRLAALLSWWRFRSMFVRRWGGYLGVVLVVGILGGVAMGAVAGARRTQGAFPVYLASTNPSDVVAFDEYISVTGTGYSARVDRAIARLPYVERATYVIGFDPTLTQRTKVPVDAVAGETPPAFEGSLNGEYTTVDRATVVRGRMFDPNVQDELVMSASGAEEYGLHVGSTLAIGVYSDAQVSSAVATGVLPDRPHVSVELKLVGIVESSSQVVEDDDAALGSQFGVFTPALTRRLATCCAGYSYVALKLDGGTRHEAAVVRAIERLVPAIGGVGGGQTNASTVALVERSIRPESIAFGAFGLIAALAALLIGGQVVGRLVRVNADDGEVLRALGAGPVMTTADGLVGVLGAVVLGAVLAVVVAVGLSPLAPFGAVRPLYPDLGIAFDWTVLGLGFAVLVVVLGTASVLLAYRAAPHRGDLARRRRAERAPTLSRVAAASGLGPSATTGIRSAFGSGGGRDAAPVRSAILGSVLAVVVVASSIIFGASLTALGLPSPALRVELELRAVVRLLGGRGPARRADRRPARPRPGRGALGRGVLRGRGDRRAAGGRPRGPPERSRRPDAAHWAPIAVGEPSGPRTRDLGRAPQAGRRHRRRRHRSATASAPAHRRDGHDAYHWGLGQSGSPDG